MLNMIEIGSCCLCPSILQLANKKRNSAEDKLDLDVH